MAWRNQPQVAREYSTRTSALSQCDRCHGRNSACSNVKRDREMSMKPGISRNDLVSSTANSEPINLRQSDRA